MTRDPLPGLGVPVVVATGSHHSRDQLAHLDAGCDCTRRTRYLPGWASDAALAAVLHEPPYTPHPLLEPRLIVLRAPAGSTTSNSEDTP